jgi:integrase
MATIEKRTAADGAITYRAKVRLRGHPVQTGTFERLTDAKKWTTATESAIREGRHFKTTEAKRHTLADVIDRYIVDVIPTKRDGPHQAAQLLWWREELGAFALADITPARVAEARDKLAAGATLRGERRSPATVVRYLAALSHAFTIAVKEWGWVDDSPLRKVRKPTEPRGRVRFLSDEERARLLAACRESANPLLYPAVVLALSTGMRAGEIMGLYWQEPRDPPPRGAWGVVDVSTGRIVLHLTKNGERRTVPLTGHALDCLRELAKVRRLDTALVFPGAAHPTKPIDLRSPWDTAIRIAEIHDFRFHDLRHSAASYLAMNGASLAEIAETLGHKTLSMVKRYSHLSEAHTSDVVGRMNAKIFGGATNG